MRKYLDGLVLDSLSTWFVVAILILLAMLVWGIIQVQDHYYFPTVPFTFMGVKVP